MHHAVDSVAYTMAFVTPVVEHWLEIIFLRTIVFYKLCCDADYRRGSE